MNHAPLTYWADALPTELLSLLEQVNLTAAREVHKKSYWGKKKVSPTNLTQILVGKLSPNVVSISALQWYTR